MDLGVFVRAVCGESRTYGNEGVRVYTCSVVVGPTHPICSMIYGSTGATHFDQLAKILTDTKSLVLDLVVFLWGTVYRCRIPIQDHCSSFSRRL